MNKTIDVNYKKKFFVYDIYGNCAFDIDDEGFLLLISNYQQIEDWQLTILEEKSLLKCDDNTQIMLIKVETLRIIGVDQNNNESKNKILPYDELINLAVNGKVKNCYLFSTLFFCEQNKIVTSKVPIVYQDEYLVAVNKPAGILVHRSTMSSDRTALLQKLSKQLGVKVNPIHRLDRPTSGIVLFGIQQQTTSDLFKLFRERDVKKSYLALVRGFTPKHKLIDYPLANAEKNNQKQEAISEYWTLAQVELPIPVGPYETSRYSLIKVDIQTGRMHQIRRHLRHDNHPIIGDTKYGDTQHNLSYRDNFHCHRLLLMAYKLEFKHPVMGELLQLKINPDVSFAELLNKINININDCQI
ncbi:pseudouridine synthase [Lentisphaerota bacterium WC36G]|nr:hypothetical protein LJT99_08330 [Lentisphaerae bacterium WC36]